MDLATRPRLTVAEALDLASRHFGLDGAAEDLVSDRDQNFRLTTPGGDVFVLKVAHPEELPAALDLQNRALLHLAGGRQAQLYPSVVPAASGETMPAIDIDGRRHRIRVVTYLPGRPLADIDARPPSLLRDIGTRIGVMDRELASFAHPAMHRPLHWDSKLAFGTVTRHLDDIANHDKRTLVQRALRATETALVPRLPVLPMGVIHNDANTHNLLIDDDRVTGIIDFGDMVHTYRVCEAANAAAYLMLERDDPVGAAAEMIRSYVRAMPLTAPEAAALPDFLVLRLCLSVTLAAHQRKMEPDNDYLGITEAPAWALLEMLHARAEPVANELRAAAMPVAAVLPPRSVDELTRARSAVLSATLSTAYRTPLKIVRGSGAYLYDESGRRYLDCVNNVCHVGHCHPHVVAAGQTQMAALNTNTRYLHDAIVVYAERLAALLPDPLAVCFLVNSGSEANDLALRLARAHTGAEDLVVIEHAYHGHTSSLIDASPYKHDGPGGRGAPDTTHTVMIPDRFRGPYGYDDPRAGPRYAAEAGRIMEHLRVTERRPAAFVAESILGVAGQIELPPGYLADVYDRVRGAGGVCIADEVQVGFGRVGTHMWGFEMHGVIPDIVTMGKPMGNGHPLAAVVTTRAVASSFETGMEYFNTFGGNPVSCAIGLAVLEVIETESLQQHAHDVGAYFLEALRALQADHPLIGDVRGRGLFLGIELVRDPATREPAAEEATAFVEQMKDRGILLSTDGPYHNVVKIKPPLVITRDDVEDVITAARAVWAV